MICKRFELDSLCNGLLGGFVVGLGAREASAPEGVRLASNELCRGVVCTVVKVVRQALGRIAQGL